MDDENATPGVTKVISIEESHIVSRERGQLVADDHGAMFNV